MKTLEELQEIAIETIRQEQFLHSPYTLYEPIHYTMEQEGKRIRPLLTLLASELFEGNIENAKPSALAIETAHNFTLLHDDIMDASPLRRGKETVYKKYGTDKAILSGDTMLAIAYQYLLRSPKALIAELMECFTKGMIDVFAGQAYDMEFEQRNDVRIEEYIDMISLKTGALLATSLQLGAITAQAKPQDIENLYEFGINIGIAFQLMDDILDCWSNLEDFGKVTGTDIADNKKTFLYLKSLELAEKDDKEILTKYFSSTNFDKKEKEDAIKSIYHKLNLKAIAQELMQEYNNKAMESLDKIGVDNQRKQNLICFANILMQRNK